MRPLSETKHLNYASSGAGVAHSVTELWDRDRAFFFFLPAGVRAQILHSGHSGPVVHSAACPPLLFPWTKLFEIRSLLFVCIYRRNSWCAELYLHFPTSLCKVVLNYTQRRPNIPLRRSKYCCMFFFSKITFEFDCWGNQWRGMGERSYGSTHS